jgi:hypothetical protein
MILLNDIQQHGHNLKEAQEEFQKIEDQWKVDW